LTCGQGGGGVVRTITLESQRTEIIERIAQVFVRRQFGRVTVRRATGELTEDSYGNPLGVLNLTIDPPVAADTWPANDMNDLDQAIRDAADEQGLGIICISPFDPPHEGGPTSRVRQETGGFVVSQEIRPTWLLRQAEELAKKDRGPVRLRSTDLRRSVSASYNALFHSLVGTAARQLLACGTSDERHAWERSFDHGALLHARRWIVSPRALRATTAASRYSRPVTTRFEPCAPHSPPLRTLATAPTTTRTPGSANKERFARPTELVLPSSASPA